MTFLVPLFLVALLAVAIPIIIHLLNLKKPERVSFSTLSFFRELQKSTIRRLKIKRLLLLAIRTAMIMLLAMALSRPFLNPTGFSFSSNTPVLYGLLIDNGIGMSRIDANGPYINQAREVALGIVQNGRSNDRYLIYNTHGELIRSGIMDVDQAISVIESLDIAEKGAFRNERWLSLASAMDSWIGESRVIFRITSNNVASLEAGNLTLDESIASRTPVNYVIVGDADGSNIVVSGLRTTGTSAGVGRPLELEVEVTNLGNQTASNQFISLESEGKLAGQYQSTIEPSETASFYFEIIPDKQGDITGWVLLEGDVFPADNIHYFSISIPESRQILMISEDERTASYLSAVLTAAEQLQGQIRITEILVREYSEVSDLNAYNTVVLNGISRVPDDLQDQLVQFVQSGKGLVFYPSQTGDIPSYNRFLSRLNAGEITGLMGDYGSFQSVTRVDRIREGHPIIDDIFDKQLNEDVRITLPSIYYYFRHMITTSSQGVPILRTALEDAILSEFRFGSGRVLVSSLGTDPGWSAFPGSTLFAPIFYRTVLYASAAGSAGHLQHTLGNAFNAEMNLSDSNITIRNDDQIYLPDAYPTFSGLTRINYDAVEWSPGLYEITAENNNRMLAVNFDIIESDFRALSTSDITSNLTETFDQLEVFDVSGSSLNTVQNEIFSAGFGIEVWYWFIILAIALMILESIVSRWYKAETIT